MNLTTLASVVGDGRRLLASLRRLGRSRSPEELPPGSWDPEIVPGLEDAMRRVNEYAFPLAAVVAAGRGIMRGLNGVGPRSAT